MGIAENIARIYEKIEKSCKNAGRNPAEVRLMAVSKFFPREAVNEAYAAGIELFGESRVAEAEAKFSKDCGQKTGELHLVGALQRNKAKRAAGLFDCIESVDRNELIDTLGQLTAEREKPLIVLLELNAGEAQKSGYRSEDELPSALERILRYKGLEAGGLMTIAPFTNDDAVIRAAFRRLARARERLSAMFPECRLSTLSMGMSGDFPIALEEGATLIRIGTAIFGDRTT
ncbi:MAG: YggS family pyridoxal phosphate-dependent enzyme [Spirochaetaceae bacterium]|nr:YggS family pyridoxal phosphate-dependent enzyme [Spirochaetaceae bacterium]